MKNNTKISICVLLFWGMLTCSLPENSKAQTLIPVWSDEFTSTTLDPDKWSYDIGTSNDHVHYYTNRPENVQIQNGTLRIIARKESYMGQNYTSASIKTKHLAAWKYGRIEARIKLPYSPGFVPAFWLQPEDEVYGWWPSSGEIDIMEHPTNQLSKIYGTVHTDAYNSFTGSGPRGSNITIPDAESAFHVYAVEWSQDRIDFFVDDQKYFIFYNDHSGYRTWPFDQPFYLILNLAVGGGWVGPPTNNTVFPAIMEVDYVRVYQRLVDIDINGPDFLIPFAQNTLFSLPEISGASYQWEVPSGANIAAGQNTRQIRANWGAFSGAVIAQINSSEGTRTSSYPVTIAPNYVKNAGFEKGSKYWQKTVAYPAQATFTLSQIEHHSGSRSVCVEVQKLGSHPWDIQLSQRDLRLSYGEQYECSFWAKSEIAGGIITAAIINQSTFTLYTNKAITLTDTWTKYSFAFKATTTAIAAFNIDLGSRVGKYYLDDFTFTTAHLQKVNQVTNADFAEGTTGWVLTTLSTAQATGGVQDGVYAVAISNGGAAPWDIFFGQTGKSLEKGKEYHVSFDAYAVAPRTITAIVGKNSDPWTVYCGSKNFNLTTTKQTFQFTFIMNDPTDTQARMGFDIGGSDIDLFFDNIFLSYGKTPSKVRDENGLCPTTSYLLQNYPNPFNPSTTIEFHLPDAASVRLSIFNIKGQGVADLLDGRLPAGRHSLTWSAFGLASGIYLCRLQVGERVLTKKLVLQR